MPEAGGLTLLGVDVRALAQSAADYGRMQQARLTTATRLTGVDCFGDLDARAPCDAFTLAARCSPDGLAEAAIATAIADAQAGGAGRADLIVGGGLDARPDLLRRLDRHFRRRGNGPDVAGLLAQPLRWFRLLDRLDIAHPPVRSGQSSGPKPDTQRTPDGWLLKHAASCGGQGVMAVSDAGPSRDRGSGLAVDAYWQRFVAGPVASVLFIADGRDARIVGFNRLFFEAQGKRPFRYAGAIAWGGPSRIEQRLIRGWVDRLTQALGLRGINGIDLVLPESGGPLLLELNARPTATLELHAERLPGGAAHCHLEACDGRLLAMSSQERTTAPRLRHGYRVVCAPRPITITHCDWPAWCRDRPAPGTGIGLGEPICTVHAQGRDAATVERLLWQRAATIVRSLPSPTTHSPDALDNQAA